MRERFRDIARQAADKERQWEYKEAGELWKKALFLAKKNPNVDHCRLRADFCLNSMFTRRR
ncbi:ANR family transcriptional regulator [Salmonella enterica]|nr:ANR family transcriptional regulator [Salmonella enterica]EJU2684384.1 ANR family transcriptional regulator [Salmonella enterica]EJX3842459.1 ANR family transcriptional regulator [Salmonella enterica]EJX4248528.1 ANR family transcriptional regulator [Salmonella enterica]EJX4537267.1 ANR family transcriptional regulator [Salmonella enterica]